MEQRLKEQRSHNEVLQRLLEEEFSSQDFLVTPEIEDEPKVGEKYSTARTGSPEEEKISSVGLMTEDSLNPRGRGICWERVAEFMQVHPEVCRAHESLKTVELVELIAKFYHFDKLFTLKKASKGGAVVLEDKTQGFFKGAVQVRFSELSRELKIELIKSFFP